MKALTVQQPWAWAIMQAGKDIENRTTAWTYRGRLAIHAGQRWSDRGRNVVQDIAGIELPLRIPWTRGAIIGTVDLVGAHPDTGCCRPWGESDYTEHGGRIRHQVVHLELADPRPCTPIDCPGRFGLWPVPPNIVPLL